MRGWTLGLVSVTAVVMAAATLAWLLTDDAAGADRLTGDSKRKVPSNSEMTFS
jgi:hypothetical protein